MVEIKFEAVMSASAPVFQLAASATTDIPTQQSEGLTADELKQQQIAQLYQYYNSVLAQQDETFVKEMTRMPRLGNPNHFSKDFAN